MVGDGSGRRVLEDVGTDGCDCVARGDGSGDCAGGCVCVCGGMGRGVGWTGLALASQVGRRRPPIQALRVELEAATDGSDKWLEWKGAVLGMAAPCLPSGLRPEPGPPIWGRQP